MTQINLTEAVKKAATEAGLNFESESQLHSKANRWIWLFENSTDDTPKGITRTRVTKEGKGKSRIRVRVKARDG